MTLLDQWNAMPSAEAADMVLPCCGSRAWAWALVARRPLTSLPDMLAASDAAWWSLPATDWQEAFDSHPRIGETHAQGTATATSLQWSVGEQRDAATSTQITQTALAEASRAYEVKFQRVFLIRATGRTADDMLAILRRRMENTPEAELRESAEQQCEITRLRLERWLSEQEDGGA